MVHKCVILVPDHDKKVVDESVISVPAPDKNMVDEKVMLNKACAIVVLKDLRTVLAELKNNNN